MKINFNLTSEQPRIHNHHTHKGPTPNEGMINLQRPKVVIQMQAHFV